MDAARVLALIAQLRAQNIPAWIDGGWAIDALLETQTRPHDDLDLVARLDDTARIERVLGRNGYDLAGGGVPLSYELVDEHGHQVDVHPVSFAPTGEGRYRMVDGSDWVYSAQAFTGSGRILGHEVPSLTPEVVMVNHTPAMPSTRITSETSPHLESGTGSPSRPSSGSNPAERPGRSVHEHGRSERIHHAAQAPEGQRRAR